MLSKTALFVGGGVVLSLLGYKSYLNKSDSIFSSEIMDQSDMKYMEYVVKFGKKYQTKSEYRQRKQLFLSKQIEIDEWNNSNQSSTIGHN